MRVSGGILALGLVSLTVGCNLLLDISDHGLAPDVNGGNGGTDGAESDAGKGNTSGNSGAHAGDDNHVGGSGGAGSGDAGSSDAGSSDAGSSDAGSSAAGSSTAGSSTAGSGAAGSSTAGSSAAGSSAAGSSAAGSSAGGVGGQSSDLCAAGNKRCSVAGRPELCVNNMWAPQAVCSGATPACVAGDCKACVAGSKACASQTMTETCNTDNTWNTPTACVNGCAGAGICNECAAGSARCVGTARQSCSGGSWSTSMDCSGGFCNDAGVCGVCANGSKHCSGNSTQTCSSGAWGTLAACSNSACSEGNGCIGSCTPNTFKCDGLANVCSATGTWVPTGATNPCSCNVPNRFVKQSATLVLDTKTNLTWDINMRAAANWPTAVNTCTTAGMSVPTLAQWQGVMQLMQGTTTCNSGTPPFDQAAMPTTAAEIKGAGSSNQLWVGTVEQNMPGEAYSFIASLSFSGSAWTADLYDTHSSDLLHYRCVK